MVIASLKSWDGTRVLGVFETEDIALEQCRLNRIDTESEDFNLDFVTINKISVCQTMLVDHNSYGRSFRRVHVYDDESDQTENITSK